MPTVLSSPSPSLIFAISARSIFKNLSAMRSSRTRREVAVQRWPVEPNAPFMTPARARLKSASPQTTAGFLPPISQVTLMPRAPPMVWTLFSNFVGACKTTRL